MNKFQR